MLLATASTILPLCLSANGTLYTLSATNNQPAVRLDKGRGREASTGWVTS